MKIFGVCALVLLMSANCIASSQVYNIRPVSVYTYDDYAVVRFEPSTVNNEGCTDTVRRESYFSIEYTTSSHADNMHAAILSAIHTGKEIGVGISGCRNWVNGLSIPKAYRIELYSDK